MRVLEDGGGRGSLAGVRDRRECTIGRPFSMDWKSFQFWEVSRGIEKVWVNQMGFWFGLYLCCRSRKLKRARIYISPQQGRRVFENRSMHVSRKACSIDGLDGLPCDYILCAIPHLDWWWKYSFSKPLLSFILFFSEEWGALLLAILYRKIW